LEKYNIDSFYFEAMEKSVSELGLAYILHYSSLKCWLQLNYTPLHS